VKNDDPGLDTSGLFCPSCNKESLEVVDNIWKGKDSFSYWCNDCKKAYEFNELKK
jgi:uncharacterized protein YbaR (Trm112 family)